MQTISSSPDRWLKVSIVGIFIIMAMASLYLAKDFFLPLFLAIILMLTLRPIVRRLERLRIPASVSALVLVVGLSTAIAGGVYSLAGPFTNIVGDSDRYRYELLQKFEFLRRPISQVQDVEEQVSEIGENEDSSVQKVSVQGPSLITEAASGILDVFTTIVIFLVILVFLLASGDLFYQKLINTFERFGDKKRALKVVYDIERDVSAYLLTITGINGLLGVAVGSAFYALGMPSPILWGVAAALFNFVPYIGSAVGIFLSGVVAIVTFPELQSALAIPVCYLLLTFFEGQFITPVAVGRRLSLNPVVVFVNVAFWAWMWGIAGALIAVPLLVVINIFASHFEGLRVLSEFLSGRTVQHNEPSETKSETA